MGRFYVDRHGPIYGNALHASVFHGQNDMLLKILPQGQDHLNDKIVASSETKCLNFSPILLSIAIAGDQIQIFKTLLAHGAIFDTSDLVTLRKALENMILFENVQILDTIVKQRKIDLYDPIDNKGLIFLNLIRSTTKQKIQNWLTRNKQWILQNNPKVLL